MLECQIVPCELCLDFSAADVLAYWRNKILKINFYLIFLDGCVASDVICGSSTRIPCSLCVCFPVTRALKFQIS